MDAVLLNATFTVCIALGIVIVALHSMQKFQESTLKKGENDFIAPLLTPKYLATREEYSHALVWYMASMVGVLGAMSVMGPGLLKLHPELKNYESVAPLGFALLLVGVLPNVPWLQDIEWHLRRFWHERAYIPAAARATADTLRASSFDFSAYKSDAVLASPSMRGIERTDFDAPRGSVEYGWARLSCLSYELGRRRDAGDTDSVDGELLDRYASDIALKRQALEADLTRYRQEKAGNKFYENNQLQTNIAAALRQIHILLGCAVRMKASRTTDISAAFRSFGFDLGPSLPAVGNQDLIIEGLAVMTTSLLLLMFAAWAAAATQLWQPSEIFPHGALDASKPFKWAFSALIVHGIAVLTADWMRARLLRKGRWFAVAAQKRQPVAANYIRIGLVCAVTGYIALCIWGLITSPPTDLNFIFFAQQRTAFALLPAATGAFYAYHLDNAELGSRPSRLWEVGSQTVVTALCGLAAIPVWLALMAQATQAPHPDYSVTANIDFMVLVTLFGAVVGASLAWYLPKAAASRRCDPLAEAKEARIEMLRTAAFDRFGSKESSKRWLEQPHPALGNRPPEDAAADMELFPKALGLLHQRQLDIAA